MTFSIVLAAGGTGGHVFPAQALGNSLVSRGYSVTLLTDSRGSAFGRDIQTVCLPLRPTYGAPWKKIVGMLSLFPSFLVALYKLRQLKPQVVVGFGGYVSAPTVAASLLLGIPVVLHQADALLGRVNRWLAPYATLLASSFPEMFGVQPEWKRKVIHVGLPLRSEIQEYPYEIPGDVLRLLVTGGSQGAKVFGDIIPGGISLLSPEEQSRIHIVQQCRAEYRDEVSAAFKKTKAHVELLPFISDMGNQYKKAHLVISRAGASSVMEAALVGRPAIFVPYPFAMDDHQTFNAIEAEKTGGAWVFKQKALTCEIFATLLGEVLNSPWKLQAASANIRKISVPHGADRFADALEQFKKK